MFCRWECEFLTLMNRCIIQIDIGFLNSLHLFVEPAGAARHHHPGGLTELLMRAPAMAPHHSRRFSVAWRAVCEMAARYGVKTGEIHARGSPPSG
jgi:hypothetical protein